MSHIGGIDMKQILSRDINLGFIFVVLFVITLTLGFFKWPLFIIASAYKFAAGGCCYSGDLR